MTLALTLVVSLLAAPIGWRIPVRGMYTQDCSWNESRTALIIVDGDDVKIRNAECGVPEGVTLVEKSPEESVAFLLGKKAPNAIALHDTPTAIPALLELAHHGEHDVRRQAIFWLGSRAGEKAAGELRQFVDDPDDDIRERAVFAIAQLPRERAVPMLIDLVKTHKRANVRKKAMFWLAQTGDDRALALIEDILK